MSGRSARRIAEGLLHVLHGLAPPRLRIWVEAVREEAAVIADDGEALRFVTDSGRGLLVLFVGARWADLFGAMTGMPGSRALAGGAAGAAVLLGLVHLAAAGAPPAMLLVNGAALVLGLAVLAGAKLWWPLSQHGDNSAMIVIAGLLLAASLFGVASHGAVRWIGLGPLMVQPSLILLPLLLMIFARSVTMTGGAALAIAAIAIALQPDRAMAGAMVAGLAVLWIARRERPVTLALAAGGAGFLVTLARPDSLPGAPYSDGIFLAAWQLHPLLGVAVWGGAVLLVLPGAVGRGGGDIADHARAVFGAIWLAVIAAAALGNYPTPLLGYGGSAILGYLVSACLLAPPRPASRRLPVDDTPLHREGNDRTLALPRAASCA